MDTLKSRVLAGRWNGPKHVGAGLRHALYQDGVRSLYRGFGAVALFSTPGNAIYFGIYETCSRHMHRHMEGPVVPLVAGLVANLATLLVWVPQDVIKERQQVLGSTSYRTLLGAVHTVHKEGGWNAFYRGFSTSVYLYTPLCVLYWVLYDDFKTRVVQWSKVASIDKLPTHWLFCGGFYAAGVSAFVTTPIDAVKIQQQVSSQPQSTWTILMRLWKKRALFRGWQSRVMAIAPNFALTIALWESCYMLMNSLLLGRIS